MPFRISYASQTTFFSDNAKYCYIIRITENFITGLSPVAKYQSVLIEKFLQFKVFV